MIVIPISALQNIRLNALEFIYFFQNHYHLRFQTSLGLYLSANTIGAPTNLLVLDTSETGFLVFFSSPLSFSDSSPSLPVIFLEATFPA